VLLGTPDSESSDIVAETVINGDPSYAGPLAGVALRLPVYHVLEAEFKSCADPGVYAHELSIMEQALEKDKISSTLERIRKAAGLS
jgi:hypothetical protein